ncbi:MAG: hypothetical protein ACT4OK_13810 [Gemmobacter sp.]
MPHLFTPAQAAQALHFAMIAHLSFRYATQNAIHAKGESRLCNDGGGWMMPLMRENFFTRIIGHIQKDRFRVADAKSVEKNTVS